MGATGSTGLEIFGRRAGCFLLAISGILLGACATTGEDDPNRVSTIPWNRPQSWEGQGSLGGFSTDMMR